MPNVGNAVVVDAAQEEECPDERSPRWGGPDAAIRWRSHDTRTLLRTRPNPLTTEQALRLRGARPAGPPPRPALEPVRVQRLADHTGVMSVCGQRVGVGRAYARRTLTVLVSDTTLAIELGDGDSHVVRRTTTSPAVTIKARSPRTVTTKT